jgi:hypothetical protein
MNWHFLLAVTVSSSISLLLIYYVPIVFSLIAALAAIIILCDVVFSIYEDMP